MCPCVHMCVNLCVHEARELVEDWRAGPIQTFVLSASHIHMHVLLHLLADIVLS